MLWLIVWLLWQIINVVRFSPLLCWAKSLACINSHPSEPWKRRRKATLQVKGLSSCSAVLWLDELSRFPLCRSLSRAEVLYELCNSDTVGAENPFVATFSSSLVSADSAAGVSPLTCSLLLASSPFRRLIRRLWNQLAGRETAAWQIRAEAQNQMFYVYALLFFRLLVYQE